MAGNFRVDHQRQTEELVGGTTVRDMVEVGFFTLPSNIYAQRRYELLFIRTGGLAADLGVLADWLETVAALPYIAGLSYIQDINAAGLLIDVIENIVTSASGKSTGIWRQPLDGMYPGTVTPHLEALSAELTADEAL